MRSILSFINKYFWKGIIGPMFAYVVPFILILFIGRIIGSSLVVPGIFSLPIISILLVFMPQSIFEFRNSSLLKRIGTTPIKPLKFLLGISIYNIVIVLTSILFIFCSCFIIFSDSMNDDIGLVDILNNGTEIMTTDTSFMYLIKNADWGSYIYTTFELIILTTLVGLFLSSVAKSTLFIQATGICIMMVSFFVGPCILPMALVGSVDVVRYLGYLIPFKYCISSGIEAFTSGYPIPSIVNYEMSSIWNVDQQFKVLNIMEMNIIEIMKNPTEINNFQDDLFITVFYKHDKILNLIMPWVFIFIFGYLVACSFRWNNRGNNKFRWNIVSEVIKQKRNINKIQNYNTNLNSENILEVHNLVKKFKIKGKELIANNDISFNIKRGRNLAIVGHNGAGKSVLIENIIGVTQYDEGTINYNFKFNKSFNEKIGIQFQDSTYPYGIKVKDLIKFLIDSYKLKISSDELNELISTFGIKSFYSKNISSLSGGQQQRINLLLSILHKPKIIILDELSTGLDIKIRNEIKKFIKDFTIKNDITIIVISHDMSEVEYLADDLLILKEGKTVLYDSISNIVKKEKSLESFVYKYL